MAVFIEDEWDPDRMMGGWGMSTAGVWMMLVVVLLLVVPIVVTLVLTLRAQGVGSRGLGGVTPSAREILDLRLARGEISTQEHASLRAQLGK